MESHPHGVLPPVPKCSKELQTAVQDDARRREVDSAKKRAAGQNADYESFAALVSMAHVKPFERRRGRREEAQTHVQLLPAWSLNASGALAPPSDCLHTSSNEHSGGEANKNSSYGSLGLGCYEARCMTADTFKREWRRAGANLQDKLKFLLALPPSNLSKVFRADLPPSILADVIDVMFWWEKASVPEKQNGVAPLFPPGSHAEGVLTHKTDHFNAYGSGCQEKFDVGIAFQILSSLCACGRFSLSLKLVGTRVRSLAVDVIERLVDHLEMNEVCEERASNLSYMCSSQEQTLTKDDLKQLANLYSDT